MFVLVDWQQYLLSAGTYNSSMVSLYSFMDYNLDICL